MVHCTECEAEFSVARERCSDCGGAIVDGPSPRFEKPELAQRQVSYSIPTNDLAKALEVMGRSIVVQIERRGDTLFVR